jgi:hypothetical protein
VTQFVQVLMGLIPRLVDDFRVFGEWFLRTGLPLFLQWAGMVGPMVVTVFENIFNAVTQLLAGGGSDLLMTWFQKLLQFGIDFTAQLPSMIPNIVAAGNAFMGWAGWLEQLVLYLLPSLVETIGKFIPQIDSLVMTYLPIFGNELFYILQVANKFADDGLPKIVDAFKKAQPEIIGFIQTLATAITQVLSAVGAAAKAVGDNIQTIRAALEPIVKFIGENSGMLMQLAITALQWKIGFEAAKLEIKFIGLMRPDLALQTDEMAAKIDKSLEAVKAGIGSAPHRAGGGPVRAGQAYRVGERGEETFVPASDGTIIPHYEGTNPLVGGLKIFGMSLFLLFETITQTTEAMGDWRDLVKGAAEGWRAMMRGSVPMGAPPPGQMPPRGLPVDPATFSLVNQAVSPQSISAAQGLANYQAWAQRAAGYGQTGVRPGEQLTTYADGTVTRGATRGDYQGPTVADAYARQAALNVPRFTGGGGHVLVMQFTDLDSMQRAADDLFSKRRSQEERQTATMGASLSRA